MDAATCQCESGSLGGSGSLEVSMSIDKGEFTLVIYGDNLPLGPNFVDVLPSTASSKLADAWDWLDPGGRMDAEIRMSSRDGESSLNMVITPMLVTVSGNDQIVNLELMRGSIVVVRSEEHTSELQSRRNLVCRLLLEKKNEKKKITTHLLHTPVSSSILHSLWLHT